MDKLLDQIESLETQARTGIASNLGMFKQIAIELVPKDLFYALEGYKVRDNVLTRLKRLAAEVPERGYLNTGDTAISIYLLLLQLKGDWVRIYMALRALKDLRGGWWSIKVAAELQDVVNAMSNPWMCEDLVDRPVSLGSRLPPRMARAGV